MEHGTNRTLARIGKTALTFAAAAIGAAVLIGSSCNLTNKAPTVPVISGPSSGVVGVPVTFKATATDPDNDSIAFQFDWGDTSTPAWSGYVASGETSSIQHTYSDSGAFSVKAKSKDGKGKESGWSDSLALGLISAGLEYPDSVYDSVHLSHEGNACCMSPDGSLLCVGSENDHDSIYIVRVSDRALLPRICVDTGIIAVAFSRDNRSVYASSGASGVLYRVDLASARAVDTLEGVGANGIVPTPDGSRLLVSASQYVLVLRADSLAVLDTIRLPYNVQDMALNQAGTTLYVSVLHGFAAVDVQGCSLRMFTQAVDFPNQVVLSPDEESLYVYSFPDSGVVVLRATDLAVTRRVNSGIPVAYNFARTLDGTHLYVGYKWSHVLDTRTLMQVDSVPIHAWGNLIMHPSGDSAYCAGGFGLYVIGKRR